MISDYKQIKRSSFFAWEMDSSSEHHQLLQEMGSLESLLASCTKPQHQQKKARPVETQPENCPRCESPNTKFCYYNNYSLSQPRYFCKSCRRYWTKGGTLRNVPVGGGCRRSNHRSKTAQDNLVPPLSHDSHDLTLAFAKDFSALGSYPSALYHHSDHGIQGLNYGNDQLVEMGNGVSAGSEMEILWGFPWSGDGNALADAGLNWHGLLNSPLM